MLQNVVIMSNTHEPNTETSANETKAPFVHFSFVFFIRTHTHTCNDRDLGGTSSKQIDNEITSLRSETASKYDSKQVGNELTLSCARGPFLKTNHKSTCFDLELITVLADVSMSHVISLVSRSAHPFVRTCCADV